MTKIIQLSLFKLPNTPWGLALDLLRSLMITIQTKNSKIFSKNSPPTQGNHQVHQVHQNYKMVRIIQKPRLSTISTKLTVEEIDSVLSDLDYNEHQDLFNFWLDVRYDVHKRQLLQERLRVKSHA